MFSRSVSALLLSVIGILAIALFIIMGEKIITAWLIYEDSTITQKRADTDRLLFDNMVFFRGQRGTVLARLIDQSDPRDALNEQKKIAQERYQAVLTGLESDDIPGGTKLAADLKRNWDELSQKSNMLFDEGARPQAERNVSRVDPWFDSVGRMIDTISKASLALSTVLRISDPVIAELVQTRQLAWLIRFNFGDQCAILRPNMNNSQPLTEAQKTKFYGGRAVVEAGWASLADLTSRDGADKTIIAAIEHGQDSVRTADKSIDALVARLDGSGQALLPPSDWNKLCNGPFNPITGIGFRSLGAAIAYAGAQRSKALHNLVIDCAAFAVAMALGIAGITSLRRRFSQPVRLLMEAIRHLTERNFAVAVPPLPHDDELGRMAVALESLRDSAATADRLAADQENRRQEELRRSGQLEGLCRDFDTMAGKSTQSLGDSATSLRDTAMQMRGQASQATDQAELVAAAAERATTNVDTVASATEELNSSIKEISHRVQASAGTAREAAIQAEKTNETVEALNTAAQRIGEVVKMITDIAGQTNLLALNATIEAARAGEAGKGFAVVASEVKTLANQTAHATEDIAQQVAEIQSTTEGAVAAIKLITQSIATINDGASAIAAAVEEQGAATQEIARNVQLAAQGTQEVTQTIHQVAQSSRQTGTAAEQVLHSVEHMFDEVGELRNQMETFLGGVRAI